MPPAAKQITDAQKAEIKDAFDLFDSDGSGNLPVNRKPFL